VGRTHRLQSILTQGSFQAPRHGPTDDFHAGQIFDGRKVQPAFIGPNVGDIGEPNSVRHRDFKIAVEEVWSDAIGMAAIGRHRHPQFTSRRVNTVDFHQLGDGFLGDLVAFIPHVCMDTGRAVPLFACLENRTDFIDKQVVFGGTSRSGQRCVAPGMEPATADAEHTAHQADCVIDSMGSYEVAFGPHVFAAH
jgi:hypothetical protein